MWCSYNSSCAGLHVHVHVHVHMHVKIDGHFLLLCYLNLTGIGLLC